jgi:diamine N-acetyltransferase
MIRLATKDDAQRIGELWLEMVKYHQEFDKIMFQPSENGNDYYERSVFSRLSDPQTRVLVADVDGKVVGYVLGMIVDITPEMFTPIRSGFLADICVRADYRRQGIGRELVERFVLWLQSQDISYFEWHVSEKNLNAIKFWKSIGGETTMLRMRTHI